MKDLLFDELVCLLKQNGWADINAREKARAVFTTICVVWNVLIGGGEFESLIDNSYTASGLETSVDYDDYRDYMTELIA